MRSTRKAFTLTEILVVMILVAVGMSGFYVVFVNNWYSYEERITRANLLNEANRIIDELTLQGRNSRRIDLVATADVKSAAVYSAQDATVILYEITNDGKFNITKNNVVSTLSHHINFANSSFVNNGRILQINLSLDDQVINRTIHIDVSSEIVPRN